MDGHLQRWFNNVWGTAPTYKLVFVVSRHTEREREKKRERERNRKRERDREGRRKRKGESERMRETKRKTQRERQGDREIQKQTICPHIKFISIHIHLHTNRYSILAQRLIACP
jgi:hypothetical protein